MKTTAMILSFTLTVLAATAADIPGQIGKPGLLLATAAAQPPATDMAAVEEQFRKLPMDARRLTGPLFWLHGDESKERLEMYLDKVAESGNGSFTAESRPHKDWLGPGWYRDLAICLEAAKKRDLKMWIFDEKWWPSQMIGGTVPPQYATKVMVATAVNVDGPRAFEAEGYAGKRYIAAVAGRLSGDGRIDGSTLVDLTANVRDGKLSWQVPAGKWKVMKFTHKQGPGLGQGGKLSTDGASQDCVDWFVNTVYQPHYDHFKAEFGKTIPGFFYDEPETRGDWGTELNKVLAEWNVDWKKAYVAYKFQLAGDDDAAARFQYMDAFAEAWGRTMYGTMKRWCNEHNVVSMGHFMEHGYLYVNPEFCAGDMMRLQSHSDMGAIDLVCQQMWPGERPHDIYQTPKLGSSITHTSNSNPDDITMCEMFGAYGQIITYPQMKWLTDQMQVRGINFMIPHSFNPRAPYDHDCPPYFYNGGYEPRYPLHRVYCDYTSRLATMLSGGRHVCPVALLFRGNLKRVGKMVTPEDMTSALQDATFDCDWLPMDVFENKASLDGKQIKLHKEDYQVLIVPPVEVIPYGTLAKAKQFFEQGGVVMGYGFLPSKSATIGKTSADIAALARAIWGAAPKPGTAACKTNAAGGRSYFLPEKPKPEEITAALVGDAAIHPALEVLQGDTGNWLHVLHRVKAGRDVFLICNQNHTGAARKFVLGTKAAGVPECWDAMRNEITRLQHRVPAETGRKEIELTLEPNESVLLVFQEKKRPLPPRLSEVAQKPTAVIPVSVDPTAKAEKDPQIPEKKRPHTTSPITGNIFHGSCEVPATLDLSKARIYLELDRIGAGPRKLEIRKAVYGVAPDRPSAAGNLDVTARVAGMVKDDSLMLRVGSLADQDPAPQKFKYLRVEYSLDGKPHVVTESQWNTVMLGMLENAANIQVNGQYAGGFIDRPYRLEITRHLKPGANTIRIAPLAPNSARLAVYAGE